MDRYQYSYGFSNIKSTFNLKTMVVYITISVQTICMLYSAGGDLLPLKSELEGRKNLNSSPSQKYETWDQHYLKWEEGFHSGSAKITGTLIIHLIYLLKQLFGLFRRSQLPIFNQLDEQCSFYFLDHLVLRESFSFQSHIIFHFFYPGLPGRLHYIQRSDTTEFVRQQL